MQSVDYSQVTRLKPCSVKTDPDPLERRLAGEADRSEPRSLRRYLIKAKLRHRFGIGKLGQRILKQPLDRCSRASNIFPTAMPKHGKELVPDWSGEIADSRQIRFIEIAAGQNQKLWLCTFLSEVGQS